jgi:hypothetical protein
MALLETGKLTNGTGLAPFVYSGVESVELDLSGVPNAALVNSSIIVNAGPGLTGDTSVSLGGTLDLGVAVDDETIGFTGASGDHLGVFTVMDKGITPDKLSFPLTFAASETVSGAANSVKLPLHGGSGIESFTYSGLNSETINIRVGNGIGIDGSNRLFLVTGGGGVSGSGSFAVDLADGLTGSTVVDLGGTLDVGIKEGSGILVDSSGINVLVGDGLDVNSSNEITFDTGILTSGFFNVNAGPGLTGDTKVNLGETLDLGVAVDDVTIGFTGASGDHLGVFTVMDKGIGVDKLNFPLTFAASDEVSGAANSVKSALTAGTGISSFTYSGLEAVTVNTLALNISGHDAITGDSVVNLGETLHIGVQTDDTTLTSESPLKVKAGGIGNTEIGFSYAGSDTKSGAANFVKGKLQNGSGIAPLDYSGAADTQVQLSGFLFNVNAGPGLTGDTAVAFGETLDLGVAVDDETIGFTGASGDHLGVFTVMDKGIGVDKLSFPLTFAASDEVSGSANSVKSALSAGTGVAPFTYSGLDSAVINLSGIPNSALSNPSLNVTLTDGITGTTGSISLGETINLGLTPGVQETGKLTNGTGLAPFVYSGVESVELDLSGIPIEALEFPFIRVNAGPGLTGDTGIYLGGRLDLGVAVDDETIGFTGASGDHLGVFTVMDQGISTDKVNFGFAGSDTKSGAANSVKSALSAGTGVAPFTYSGLDTATINLSGVPNEALANSSVNLTLSDGITGTAGNISLGGNITLGLTPEVQETGQLTNGTGLAPFAYSGVESVELNLSGIPNSSLEKTGIVNFNLSSGLTGDSSVSLGDSLNISLGEIPNSALANPTITVNPAAGLTGDSTVELGGTLDLGVAVDGTTIGFTGASGDQLGVFTVMEGGISPDKLSFPLTFAASDEVSGAANSVKSSLSAGTGVAPFTYSGLNDATIDLSGVPNAALSNSSISFNYLDEITGESSVSLGGTLTIGLSGHVHRTGILTGGSGIEPFSYSGDNLRTVNISIGEGLSIDGENRLAVSTGVTSGFFNVNAGPGLTGDTQVILGGTLDLGVAVDDETIGFTGASGDHLGVFTVMDKGIGVDKLNFPLTFAASDTVSGAANSVKAPLTAGTGIAPFSYSGLESTTVNLSGIPNSSLQSGFIRVNAGPGLTGDTGVSLGGTLDLGVAVDDETIGFTGASGDHLGVFTVMDKGITPDKLSFPLTFAASHSVSGSATRVMNALSNGSGIAPLSYDGFDTRTVQVSGFLFNVNAGPGLTGDTTVAFGETLDLGVAVDDETIGFTGASGDHLGVFTVMDQGISTDKVNFGFAGSDTKSGAANSVKEPLVAGTGLAPFTYSGLENTTINLSGVPNSALANPSILVNAGPGLTGDTSVQLGGTLDLGVAVDDETIGFTGASGDQLGVFTVMNEGITTGKINFGFAGSDTKSGAANSVKEALTAGTGVAPFTYSGLDAVSINLSGVPNSALENSLINLDLIDGITGDATVALGGTAVIGLTPAVQETGTLSNGTGIAPFTYSGVESVVLDLSGIPIEALEFPFIRVNAGPGLTGDTGIYLGGRLDLGVAVDDETIGFTGASGDHLGVFTVMDQGISTEKINFGFAGSDTKSGAANSVREALTAGTGIAPFTYSGLNSATINLSGIPGSALESGFINVNAGPGLTGDTQVLLGGTLDLGVAVDDETIGFTGASGDHLGVFTVMDQGISVDKVNFGFAGSDTKSGAANSVKGKLFNGVGISGFNYSGSVDTIVNALPLNISGTKGITGDTSVNLGETLHLGIEVDNVTLTSDSPIKIKDGGVGTDQVSFNFAQSDSKGGSANSVRGKLQNGSGVAPLNYSGSADTEIQLSGFLFNVNAGPGLTGDTTVAFGETLDLGVAVDDETIGFTGASGDHLGVFTVMDKGITPDKLSFPLTFAASDTVSGAANSVKAPLISGTGIESLSYDGSESKSVNIRIGAGISVDGDNRIEVDTGILTGFFNVNAGPGLTGDTQVILGGTLDLGVAVDDETIGFTGASGDHLGVFTVMDKGIGVDKLNFPLTFAASDDVSGAANSVKSALSAGTGIAPFTYSGLDAVTLNLSGIPNSALQTKEIVITTLTADGITGGGTVALGETTIIGLNDIPNSALLNPSIPVNYTGSLTGDTTITLGSTFNLGFETPGIAFDLIDGITGSTGANFGDTVTLGLSEDIRGGILTGGSGIETFSYSGANDRTVNINLGYGLEIDGTNSVALSTGVITGFFDVNLTGGITGSSQVGLGETLFLGFEPSPYLVYTTGDQIISGVKHFRDTVTFQDVEISGLLTATGSGDSRGIFVSNLRVTGDVSGVMDEKSLAISGLSTNDRFSTNEAMSITPLQTEGMEIFDMEYAAQATGNYLVIDVELNIGTSDNADAIVCLFKDSETEPIRAWTHNVYAPDYGQVFNMKYFTTAEDTDIHNYKVRIGRRPTRGYSPIVYVNRLRNYPPDYPYASGYLGDAAISTLLISEIKPNPTGSRW